MKKKAPARLRKKHYFGRGAMFVLCAVFAVLFLLPTVLTITNSFMSEAEIKSNYGMIFATTTGGYVSKTVNLKFIPDKVTLSQYITGLIKSPEYLLKLWNSIPPERPKHFSAYLGKIARNLAINRYKAKYAQKRLSNEFSASLDELDVCTPSNINVEDEVLSLIHI